MKGAWPAHFQDGRGFGWTRSPINAFASRYWSGTAGAASAAGGRPNSMFTTSTHEVSLETTPSTTSSHCAQAATSLCIPGTKRLARLRAVEAQPPDSRFVSANARAIRCREPVPARVGRAVLVLTRIFSQGYGSRNATFVLTGQTSASTIKRFPAEALTCFSLYETGG